ncbi:MAG: GntR family transcriptional regulator [Proteobacteria bacterium]|jgi:DNA-binding GntR family transcriptional regulator|nr:GntR family transcriptional regulator [Methylibium sp.]MBY0368094.1 GntR family transcriptional regulator [Burkholderiaceae bacterium]MCH8855268.1 GntR family transcriptional regulator [Pseudomonadota bacterium]|mmetsp:Transcript_14220/g.38956  ORF Transcript_14220/g.38956 Transcript_14220/m.38956 type:complete len:238 (+) Transcript_14220:417-1130(+)
MTAKQPALARTTPGPSAADQVYEALHRAIISGQFKDGEPLRQEELARQLHTSRIPVREALNRLEQHGLVQIKRYHGYTVAGHSRDEVEELCRFRALLEGELILTAVPRLGAAALAEAKKRCQAFARESDPVRWGELNRDFHCALYAAAGLPHHLQAAVAALDRTERYLVDQLQMTDGRAQARAEHQAILEACVAGDAKAAARLTRQHILGACERFSRHLTAHEAPPAAAGKPRRRSG